MQSKTSCFNQTMFRKHVTRFWPVWAVYLGLWLLEMPVGLLIQRKNLIAHPINVQSELLQSYGTCIVLSFIFAVLMAMAVWSFLYNSRSASGAACLPVTRTAQFTSAVLGGLVPLLAVHVVIFVLTALAELSMGLLHLPSLLIWLATATLTLLFFYGFATFCAMLTGNLIVLPAVYVVLNFTVAAVTVLVEGVADWFLYGVSGLGDTEALLWLSPAVKMFRNIRPVPITGMNAAGTAHEVVGWHFVGWGTLLIYAAAGVLLLFAALALLRRRKMETAGDVVAVQALKPVFRWCMGVGCGLVFTCMMLYLFSLGGDTQAAVFLAAAVCLVIGCAIGWLIAEMLIRRSFRVFRGRGRSWIGCAACCAVLLVGLTATEFDVLGLEKRQPKIESVEAVVLYGEGENAFLEAPESVARAMELHAAVIADKPRMDQCNQSRFFMNDGAEQSYDETVYFHLDYLLKNGGHITRDYTLPHVRGAADDAQALEDLLNCDEAVRKRKETPIPFTQENVSFGSVDAVMTAAECAAAAGYDDPADYVLCELGGFSRTGAAALTDDARTEAVRETLRDYRYIDYGRQAHAYMGDDLGYYSEKEYRGEQTIPEVGGRPDWDNIWLNYTLELTRQEAWELYSTCVLPDIAGGGLGRVWILTGGDYGERVYAAAVSVAAKRPDEESARADAAMVPVAVAEWDSEPGYYDFATTPTVDAARTAAYLAARGLRLHTAQEIWDSTLAAGR